MNAGKKWKFLAGLFWLSMTPGIKAAESRIPLEIQVEVTEVDEAKAASLGVDWIEAIGIREKHPPGIIQLGALERLTNLQADIHWLVEEGAAELLANPNLVTDSGTTATFHAGGEIPYVVSGNLGTPHVEFKPYGVNLTVVPEILKSSQIKLKITASVSAPDQTNGVVLAGTSVPALLERTVTSHVTIQPGTTLALAGLVQSQKEKKERGVPFLRRIPIVGRLFRWTRTNHRKTSIVMFVTPRVVNF
jgi:pilus assembly protein CpaC